MKISYKLDDNIQYLDEVFKDCGDFVKRKIPIGQVKKVNIYFIYIDMLTNLEMIRETMVRRIMLNQNIVSTNDGELKANVYEALKDIGITTVDLKESNNFEDVNLAVLSGDTVLFVDGFDKAVIVSTKGFPNRGIPKAETEVVVQGSKEAFSEVYRFNTALIRRRIRDTNLKLIQLKVGRKTSTDVGIMYLQDIVREDILKEVLDRIENIDVDGILDVGYIEQFIEDNWKSPFPQIQVTERPDKVAGSILEGRIAILVDNSPYSLIVPATFNTFFQASEDYYQRFGIMSFTRAIRFIAGFFAVALPGLYLALAVYHPSMIPILLTLKMARARLDVPIPAFVEILIMDLAFELLREAGVRLPGPVGNTMGIVGGLIIGQAAVEAGLVSPIVVIVVALTGISSFAVPHYSLVSGFRIMKYIILILSGFLGLYGFWMGIFFVLIHLVSLKSFGIPYMFPFTSGDVNEYSDLKDTIFRFPTFAMKKRPIFSNPNRTVRMNLKSTGNKRKKE